MLISDTAVPAWHEGHRTMPFVFASSAVTAATGMGLVAAPARETALLCPLAAGAGLTEVALARVMAKQTGIAEETFESGTAGRCLKAAEGLTAGGALLALTARGSRLRSVLSGAALLVGSALTRFGIFHAGVASAADPKYTVVPQRERLSGAGAR